MSFGALAGLAAALGIALALLGVALLKLRPLLRLPLPPRRARLPMEVVGRVALGARQGLAAVRVGDTVLLLGIGEGGVRRVGEVSESALESDTAMARHGDTALPAPSVSAGVLSLLGGLKRSVPMIVLSAAAALTPAVARAQAAQPPAARVAVPAARPQPTNPAVPVAASPGRRVAASPAVVVPQSGAQAPLPQLLQPGAGTPATVDVKAGDLKLTGTVGMVLFMGLLAVLPALLLLMTSFTRILIVLHFLRQALGTQTAPPGQLLAALALLLTFFVMGPTLERANREALQPWMNGQMDQGTMMKTAAVPFREFMLRQTPRKDLAKFVELSGQPAPARAQDVSLPVLMSAFATSELRAAFQMGFAIFLPFIVVDLVVSAVLTAMGMFMLPPTMIALPCKLLLFVLVDGWSLVVESLVRSFR